MRPSSTAAAPFEPESGTACGVCYCWAKPSRGLATDRAPCACTVGAGDVAQGADLFGRAADKFDAALDLDPRVRTLAAGCPSSYVFLPNFTKDA